MNINDPRLKRVPAYESAAPQPTGAYETQHYYNKDNGDAIAKSVATYIANGRMSLSWNTENFDGQPTTLKLMLNCGRAWVIKHAEEYDAQVVEVLLHSTINKRGQHFVLNESQHAKPLAMTNRVRSLLSVAEVGNAESAEPVRPIEKSVQFQSPGGTPVAPSASMAFLPDDGDIETLIINLESFAATAQARQLFQRDSIKLTAAEVEVVKARAATLGVVGRVTNTEIKLAKL